jgi:hypothetical protein
MEDSARDVVNGDLGEGIDHNVGIMSEPGAEGSESNEDMVIVDHEKRLTGIFESERKNCFLVGGVPASADNTATELEQAFDSQADESAPEEQQSFYRVSDAQPISDHSLLPEALQSACAGLPLHWMEPVAAPDALSQTVVGALKATGLQAQPLGCTIICYKRCRNVRCW